MNTSKLLTAASLCGVLSFSMVPAAQAAYSWIFQNTGSDCISGCTSNPGSVSNGNSASFYGHGAGAPNISANAWSNTTGSSNVDLQSGKLMTYGGGLGVVNRDEDGSSPNHSTDNSSRYDSVLFDLGAALSLDEITLGWRQNDSDITVLAYAGVGAPVLGGKEYGELLSSGWSHIGDYADVYEQSGHSMAINAGNVTSRYWLIGAFNNIISSNNWGGSDYFKIYALAGSLTECCNEVPAPSSLLLLALGLPLLRRFNKPPAKAA